MYHLTDQLPSLSTLLYVGKVPMLHDPLPNCVSDPRARQKMPIGINVSHGNSQRMRYWKTVLMEPDIFVNEEGNILKQPSSRDMINNAFHRDSSSTNWRRNDVKQVPGLTENAMDRQQKMLNVHPYGNQCDLCPLRFRRRYDLTQHKNAVHKRLRPHKCPECGDAFGHKGTLSKHIRTVHRKERKFRCEHCFHMFSERGNLNKHKMRVKACRDKESLMNGLK